MASDAFIVGEEWISEHYFNTDAAKQSFQARVTQRRKAWDAEHDVGETSARDVFSSAHRELVNAFAELEETVAKDAGVVSDAAARIARLLKQNLGFTSGLYELEQRGPVGFVTQRGLDEPARVAIVDAAPVAEIDDLLQRDAETLSEPFVPVDDEKHPIASAARLLSVLFADEDGPAFALVLAGRWVMLAERERWAEGRYLAVNLQLAVDRNDQKKGGELDRALACIAAESWLPDAEGTVWWATVFDESIKHTVGVSKDLREGVRSSIEIIANEVVRRRALRGLEPLPSSEAQPLAKQALRYLYRILFLLYAEASPELQVVPVGSGEYEEGYSLDRLRELVLVELPGDAADRTHLHESLRVLFRLVDGGHAPVTTASDATTASDLPEGLVFNRLTADLFLPSATAHIDEVGLGDEAMQRVLAHLLLSKEQRGRDRGFISYSDLGINQLGAVYEGLMSYTGFFASTDLFEVAKDGDASKGSWVVPVDRSEGIDHKDFVQTEDPITGARKAVLHERGSFVYRLAGRERQQSASYYTPEVLTRFVVSQSLEELLDQDGHTTTAAEILELTVCEPALGSGAFAIEAVRQLADEYLKRREMEVGKKVDPEQRPRELQRVKASIALHQVHGVDLNATAVELAEISLWLDTMVEGLSAPWFGLHLKRGNSLIGARRAVYSRDQVNKKSWLKDAPRPVSVRDLADNIAAGRLAEGTAGAIHHFLLPAAGWGSAVDAKEAKELAPEALARLRVWRKSIFAKPSKKQLDQLASLSNRVEALWQLALRRLTIAEREARRDIPLWEGAEHHAAGGAAVSRSEIERTLNDPEGAFQRLRRVMDAWNAIWFWPLTDTLTAGAKPPSLDEWIAGLRGILGEHTEAKGVAARYGQTTFAYASGGWEELNEEERDNLDFASADRVTDLVESTPWLRAVERIAAQQGFFHWELDFATVFERGGFDLQVGNPPWVRPRSDVDALLAEGDPWWQLAVKPTQSQVAQKRAATLELSGLRDLVVDGTAEVATTAAFVGDPTAFPHLAGLQPDLYRCFMEATWNRQTPGGVVGLIHPESHFTDEKAGLLREGTYARLRRHWQFSNETQLLFPEIDNHVSFGVHVYGRPGDVDFLMASSIYHPETVIASLRHDGSGAEPGLKTSEGEWDTRPHASRVTRVQDAALATWHALMEEPTVPLRRTRMVYAVNRSTADVIRKLSSGSRLGGIGLEFSRGWDENIDRKKGVFEVRWGKVESWEDVILQGPHLYVGNPVYKSPNPTMASNKDWSLTDLEALPVDAIPVTVYKPSKASADYGHSYTRWGEDRRSARAYFRIAWREMASNTGERTLVPTIVPPGVAHIHAVATAGGGAVEAASLIVTAGHLFSLVADFVVRLSPKAHISPKSLSRLPIARADHPLSSYVLRRTLRLVAVTEAYSSLVQDVQDLFSDDDAWSGGMDWAGRPPLNEAARGWDRDFPLRRAADRRQALVEIDALVALMLGVSIDELCTIYRTQFPVLFGYDRALDKVKEKYVFDGNGRLVPASVIKIWRQKGDAITEDECTATHPGSGIDYTYELPFVTLDREADMRQAYAHFERILEERS